MAENEDKGWFGNALDSVREYAAGALIDEQMTSGGGWLSDIASATDLLSEEDVSLMNWLRTPASDGLREDIDGLKADPVYGKLMEEVTPAISQNIRLMAYFQLHPNIDDATRQKLLDGEMTLEQHGATAQELALLDKVAEHGPEKIAFAVADTVREELPQNVTMHYGLQSFQDLGGLSSLGPDKSMSDYITDSITQSRQDFGPILGFFIGLLSGILSYLGELASGVKNFFSPETEESLSRIKVEEHAQALAAEDAAEKANAIAKKSMELPESTAVEVGVNVYKQLKLKADPNFTLSAADEQTLRQSFATMTADMVASRPQQPTTTTTTSTPAAAAVTGQTSTETSTPPPAGEAQEKQGIVVGTATTVGNYFTGDGEFKAQFDYPEFSMSDPESLGLGSNWSLSNNWTIAKIAAAFIVDSSTQGREEIIAKHIPGAEFDMDAYGNSFVSVNGNHFYLNKPGFSMQDAADVSSLAVMWLPAARAARVVGAGAKAAAGGGRILGTAAGLTAGGAAEVAGIYVTKETADAISNALGSTTDTSLGSAVLDRLNAAGLHWTGGVSAKVVGGISRKIGLGEKLSLSEQGFLKRMGIDPRAIASNVEQHAVKLGERIGAAHTAIGSPGLRAAGITAAAGGVVISGAASAEEVENGTAVHPTETPTVEADDRVQQPAHAPSQ